MSMISLSGIDKFYGDFQALYDVNAEIREGEFFSLLGPSGCGKTTLLRTIAGFEDVSKGEVLIDGNNMAGVPANKRPTNMVFQSYAIFPHLSVSENVAYGLKARRTPAAEIKEKVNDATATEFEELLGNYEKVGHGRSAPRLGGPEPLPPFSQLLLRTVRGTQLTVSRCRSQ